MSKYRKKPVVIEATQWFTNGDHPGDDCREMIELREGGATEGKVVRRYRRPDDAAGRGCEHCGRPMDDHGWIDTLDGGHKVCPGDWVITGVKGERYPCKPDVFDVTYEPVAPSGPQQPVNDETPH